MYPSTTLYVTNDRKKRRSPIGSRRTLAEFIDQPFERQKRRNLSSYLIDGSLKDLTFVSLARAHVRGAKQLGKIIDKQVLLGPSSLFVKALVTVNNRSGRSLVVR